MTYYQELKRELLEELKVDLFPYLINKDKQEQKDDISDFLIGRVDTYLTYSQQIDEFLQKFDNKEYYELVYNEEIKINLYDFEKHKEMYAKALCEAIFLKIAGDIVKQYSKKKIDSFIVR